MTQKYPNVSHTAEHQESIFKRLTPEETRILQQCNHQSFYYRVLPLGALSIGTLHYAMSKGFISPRSTGTKAAFYLACGVSSLILGKISYQRECEEKLMQLPSGPLSEMLRKKHGRIPVQTEPFEFYKEQSVPHAPLVPAPYSEPEPFDSPESLVTPNQRANYEEMRKRNREEYDRKIHSVPYSGNQQSSYTKEPPLPQKEPSQPYTKSSPKNKYGDEWEN